MTIAYCVRCKKKQEMKDTSEGKTKKGVLMIRGYCPVCHTKMCKIGGR